MIYRRERLMINDCSNGQPVSLGESEEVKLPSWPLIRRIVESPAFSLSIALLILVSVSIIVIETLCTLSPALQNALESMNDILTAVFIVELTMRWLVSETSRNFLRSYWIDIIAVVPMFRMFRLGRVLRLLRLFRLISLGAPLQRRFTVFSRIFQGQYLEFSIIIGFILFSVVFGTIGFSQFEIGQSDIHSNTDAFWKAFFSLLSGEYADHPESLGGKIIAIILLMFGMGVFAMLTGTFSALMIEKIKENAMHTINNYADLKNHIVICGYSSKVSILAVEFLLDPDYSKSDIVIVSEQAELEELKERGVQTDRISIVQEDFTKIEALKKAKVETAKAAIILSESGGHRTTQDIDARSLLAAMTIERMNPNIHTSVEIYHEEYMDHLRMGGVEDIVIQGEVSGKLLAKVAMEEGMLAFFKDLLSRQQGNTIFFTPLPEDLHGFSIDEAMAEIHKRNNQIIVGVRTSDGKLHVNPGVMQLNKGDQLMVISPIS